MYWKEGGGVVSLAIATLLDGFFAALKDGNTTMNRHRLLSEFVKEQERIEHVLKCHRSISIGADSLLHTVKSNSP